MLASNAYMLEIVSLLRLDPTMPPATEEQGRFFGEAEKRGLTAAEAVDEWNARNGRDGR